MTTPYTTTQTGTPVVSDAHSLTVGADGATLRDKYTGADRLMPCAALVDCGFRVPGEPLLGAVAAAGDCVAPRTVHEAILEGRRAALAL